MSRALLERLRDVAQQITADADVKAVVVAGGERAFAAGADISEFTGQDAAAAVGRAFRDAFDAIAAIPRPVIAAIRGYALGGGLELASACDLRVAGENARLGQPEILLGIIPGAGGTQRLTRLVGPARAKEIVWSGRQVRAAEALAIGLVDRVVPPGDEEAAALQWAGELARGCCRRHGTRQAGHRPRNRAARSRTGSTSRPSAFVEVFGTEDAVTGVQSFLADGPGKAKFAGR